MLNWIVNVSTNTIFIYTSKDISLLPNWTTLMFKQIMHWSDNHWSKWTPSHDHFPLWHHCAHLNIPKLHNSCVYSWVFKLAWCLQLFWMCENEFGGANVGEKSSINQKWDAWEVRGLNTCANTNMKKKGFCKQPLVIYCFWIWLRGYSLLLRRWTTKKSGMIHIYLIKKRNCNPHIFSLTQSLITHRTLLRYVAFQSSTCKDCGTTWLPLHKTQPLQNNYTRVNTVKANSQKLWLQ